MINLEKENPLISIIVPIYNTEEYLEECIKSLVNQTYKNLEIILINDGSTDLSLEICKKWKKIDNRILIIDKKNSGQADSRNIAVKQAKGKLITFVDSDDWIDESLIEKLYNAQKKYDADISMCEAYTENAKGDFSDYSLQRLENELIDIQNNKEYLLTVRYTLWTKLYKKELFTENFIEQPSIKFEDFATVPLLYALSKKIACVDEALYYYRYRMESTIRDVNHIDDRIITLQYLVDGFKRFNLEQGWQEILFKICTERGLILMRQVYPMLNKRFKKFCDDYDFFLKRNFSIGLSNISREFYNQCKKGSVNARLLGNYNLAVWGSYNLMIIAKTIMNLGIPDYLDNHDSFSSIISATSVMKSEFYEWNLEHKIPFREKHIVQDITKTFMRKSPCQFKDIDFYLIDLLEERYDIAELDGAYFTLSDAFKGMVEPINLEYRVMKLGTEEVTNLWKESCIKFVERLKKYVDERRIIIVKSFLAEYHGENLYELKQYKEIEEIKRINASLDIYYDFLQNLLPNAIVCEFKDSIVYTDENFRHGCYPWHWNSGLYWSVHLNVLSNIKLCDSASVDIWLKEHATTYKERNKNV